MGHHTFFIVIYPSPSCVVVCVSQIEKDKGLAEFVHAEFPYC
jgi:hypothetical protein